MNMDITLDFTCFPRVDHSLVFSKRWTFSTNILKRNSQWLLSHPKTMLDIQETRDDQSEVARSKRFTQTCP